jgi:hypothetical protein
MPAGVFNEDHRRKERSILMTFETLIESTGARFTNHGRFELLPAESIIEVLRREKVPNAPGVYAYFQRDDLEHPLYIGKAGTMMTGGSWQKQGISERHMKRSQNPTRG